VLLAGAVANTASQGLGVLPASWSRWWRRSSGWCIREPLGLSATCGCGARSAWCRGPALPQQRMALRGVWWSGVTIWHPASRIAFRVRVRLSVAEPPQQPVLFIDPWSGGRKVTKVGLGEEAPRAGWGAWRRTRVRITRSSCTTPSPRTRTGLPRRREGYPAIVTTAAAEHGLPLAGSSVSTRNYMRSCRRSGIRARIDADRSPWPSYRRRAVSPAHSPLSSNGRWAGPMRKARRSGAQLGRGGAELAAPGAVLSSTPESQPPKNSGSPETGEG